MKTERNPRGAGRPPKKETLDALREKGERETLKLCADLRSKISSVANKIAAKTEDPSIQMEGLTKALDTLSRAGETTAKMSATIRRAKVGEDVESSSPRDPRTAEEVLKGLKELK